MLWHIEVKFCIWFCFTVLQIKWECCQFALIFVGVMPLLEFRILKTQFSALFFYMPWHIELTFYILVCFTVLQIKFECCQFPSIFVGVMPLLELRILEIPSFLQFLLRALTYWAETLHMTLFNVQKIKFECHNAVSVWLSVHFLHFPPTYINIFSWKLEFYVHLVSLMHFV